MNYQELSQVFEQRYGHKPTHYSRAPGRVNLIGEHIDYMGYGVLPFALQQECVILYSLDANEIHIQHENKDLFPGQVIKVEEIDKKIEFVNDYAKYFIAGYKAASEYNNQRTGIRALVSGNVPFSAGLSSSSSLVVAAAFASLLNQADKHQLVDSIIKHERAAGTACGGMDQTISVFGQEGGALFIEFEPTRLTEVQLPQGYSFVIANSLTESKKLETLGKHYNKRVSECRVAIKLLELKLGLETNFKTLRQLQEHLKLPLPSLVTLVELIPKGEIEIAALGYLDLPKLLSDIPYFELVLEQNKTFNPYNRAKHVIEEAYRVIKFKEVSQLTIPATEKAVLLGILMNESQQSCAQLYECSSSKLDELTSMAISFGALGSRLTGAGWGGCSVSLVENGRAQEFIARICKEFYGGVFNQNVIFLTQPSKGANAGEI